MNMTKEHSRRKQSNEQRYSAGKNAAMSRESDRRGVCVCVHACVQELGRRGEARRQLARGLGARPQPQPWRSAKERVIRGTHSPNKAA